MLAAQGCSVLMISLRAHGDSTGDFDDMGYCARNGIVASVEFLERRRPGKPIIVHGLSMGGAAAVFAASELAHRVQGYILDSPFRDLKLAVRNRTENALPPLLDRIAYMGLLDELLGMGATPEVSFCAVNGDVQVATIPEALARSPAILS